MMVWGTTDHAPRSQRVGAIMMLIIAVAVIGVMSMAAVLGRYRFNMTPSEPLGLWQIVTLDRPVRRGDIVFVCLPADARFYEARKRSYLRSGLCPGGYAPLIKTVIATERQVVDIGNLVRVDGAVIASSAVVGRDGMGRQLRAYPSGIVPAGQVFLHSSFIGSYDSRYFGPVPVSGILGRAQEVFTYAP